MVSFRSALDLSPPLCYNKRRRAGGAHAIFYALPKKPYIAYNKYYNDIRAYVPTLFAQKGGKNEKNFEKIPPFLLKRVGKIKKAAFNRRKWRQFANNDFAERNGKWES